MTIVSIKSNLNKNGCLRWGEILLTGKSKSEILISTYVVLDFLSLIAYAMLARKLIVWIKANPKTINTISACVLIIIALIIAFIQKY